MARLQQYVCKCGYEVMASPNGDGHDLLMMSDLYHFACKGCREIVDIYTSHDEVPLNPVCPKCGSKDLERWNPVTGKCPKCGGSFKKTGMYFLAD